MRSCLRLAALAAAAAAALACWCARPAPDWALARELLREYRRAGALERRDERSRRLHAVKTEVTAEARAGRLSLAEAARRVGEAEEVMEGDDPLVCPYRRVESEPGLCLNVLLWAATSAGPSPERAAGLARLQAEYRRRFGEPPPPSYLLWGEGQPDAH